MQAPIFIFNHALTPKPAPFLQVAVDPQNSIPTGATGPAVIWEFAPPERFVERQGLEVVENNIWPEPRVRSAV